MQNVVMDGIEYRVRIVFGSLVREFAVVEGPNSGTSITSRRIRDVLGTRYNYSMTIEANPAHPEDYDAFYDAISAPYESHKVVMPYGQDTLTFDAEVTGGRDTLGENVGSFRRWRQLQVEFRALAPQKGVW